jgi:hypothetical protein
MADAPAASQVKTAAVAKAPQNAEDPKLSDGSFTGLRAKLAFPFD